MQPGSVCNRRRPCGIVAWAPRRLAAAPCDCGQLDGTILCPQRSGVVALSPTRTGTGGGNWTYPRTDSCRTGRAAKSIRVRGARLLDSCHIRAIIVYHSEKIGSNIESVTRWGLTAVVCSHRSPRCGQSARGVRTPRRARNDGRPGVRTVECARPRAQPARHVPPPCPQRVTLSEYQTLQGDWE